LQIPVANLSKFYTKEEWAFSYPTVCLMALIRRRKYRYL